MSKRNVAVLDFGSNHISVMIGDKGVNGTFDVRGFAQSSYSGFMNGEILEPELLSEVLCQTILNAAVATKMPSKNRTYFNNLGFSIRMEASRCLR